MAFRKPGRGVDRAGRSKQPPSYVMLDRWFLHHEAFRALSPVGRSLILELLDRFRGDNNGKVVLSVREAQERLGISKETTTWAFRELEMLGFIKVTRQSAFSLKTKLAREFALTWLPVGDAISTREFAALVGERLAASKRAFVEERARVNAERKARAPSRTAIGRPRPKLKLAPSR